MHQPDVRSEPEDEQPTRLPAFDLDGFTPYRLAVAAKRTSEELARQYKARFGISIPEWRVLVHLAHSGNVSVRDIEARVALEKYEVSRAAKRLREAGLIARTENETDRRLVQLSDLLLQLGSGGEAPKVDLHRGRLFVQQDGLCGARRAR